MGNDKLSNQNFSNSLIDKSEFITNTYDSLPHPFIVINVKNHEILIANKSAIKSSKLKKGMTCYQLNHNKNTTCSSRGLHPCPIEIIKATKKSFITKQNHCSGDTSKEMEVHSHPILNKDKEFTHLIQYSIDITEKIKAEKEKEKHEKQNFQASKLSSFGTLAGGIAHELNNPLTGIVGFAQLLKKKITDPKTLSYIEPILECSFRMKEIIKNMNIHCKISHGNSYTDININKIIQDSLAEVSKSLKKRNITISLSLNKSIPTISGDNIKIESIFKNLIKNSKDSFDKLKEVKEKSINVSTKLNENQIIIKYEDTAVGIKEEHLDKIFDPFFTTKEIGKGTGLGLYTAYQIIAEHNGKIEVKSKIDNGTKFIITFNL